MLVLLVFAEILDGFVQIIVQLIQWRVTSLPLGALWAQGSSGLLAFLSFIFRDDFLHGFFHVFLMDFDLHFGSISASFCMIFASLIRT